MSKSYETSIGTFTFKMLLPSRGEDLARRLLSVLKEEDQLVLKTAYLMYNLSPTKGRECPTYKALQDTHHAAVRENIESLQKAGLIPAPVTAYRRFTAAFTASSEQARKAVLSSAVVVALAMGLATVPPVGKRRSAGNPCYVRYRELAQLRYQYARELLALLSAA